MPELSSSVQDVIDELVIEWRFAASEVVQCTARLDNEPGPSLPSQALRAELEAVKGRRDAAANSVEQWVHGYDRQTDGQHRNRLIGYAWALMAKEYVDFDVIKDTVTDKLDAITLAWQASKPRLIATFNYMYLPRDDSLPVTTIYVADPKEDPRFEFPSFAQTIPPNGRIAVYPTCIGYGYDPWRSRLGVRVENRQTVQLLMSQLLETDPRTPIFTTVSGARLSMATKPTIIGRPAIEAYLETHAAPQIDSILQRIVSRDIPPST